MEEDEEDSHVPTTEQDHVDTPQPTDAVQQEPLVEEEDPGHSSAAGNEKRWGNAFKVQWIKV